MSLQKMIGAGAFFGVLLVAAPAMAQDQTGEQTGCGNPSEITVLQSLTARRQEVTKLDGEIAQAYKTGVGAPSANPKLQILDPSYDPSWVPGSRLVESLQEAFYSSKGDKDLRTQVTDPKYSLPNEIKTAPGLSLIEAACSYVAVASVCAKNTILQYQDRYQQVESRLQDTIPKGGSKPPVAALREAQQTERTILASEGSDLDALIQGIKSECKNKTDASDLKAALDEKKQMEDAAKPNYGRAIVTVFEVLGLSGASRSQLIGAEMQHANSGN